MRYVFAIAAAFFAAFVLVAYVHSIQDRLTSCSYAHGDQHETARCNLAFDAHGAAGVEWLRTREAVD